MTTNKLKALELFAGIGGFRLGMANANIQTVWANDINELCCKVYESNFGKDSIVLGDINEISILDIPNHDILTAARDFCVVLGATPILNLYGVTDGKAVGTYVELTFNQYLSTKYEYTLGSAALGIDFPGLEVDLKVTSIRQPQSSCPFRNASQKVYGLGYHLLILVYEKIDEHSSRTANLKFQNVVFVSRERTGDYQTTYGLREILRRNGNKEDVIAFLEERNFPLDEIGREILAERILQQPPEIGYLTISNALQWRLQYSRIIQVATTMTTVSVENLLLG
ncbi:MAG: DNA cytosine methyltransferase [Nostoc sp.]|uniref:DNA cytosine methyltransferase n=1 Tax=Nostoc sp. TaxID=1180 RepID=UPI002FFA797D